MRPWRSPLVVIGGTALALLAVAATLAPWIAPYDPRAPSGPSLARPSSAHLLGTNDVGQDIFSELIWGARTSLVVAVSSALLALVFGALLGSLAGLLGGWADLLAMRLVDVFLALPLLPLIVLVAALVGPSRRNVIAVIGFISWPGVARVVRGETRRLRARGFVLSSRGFGGGPGYVLRRHVLPGLAPILLAGFVSVAAHAVTLEAGLAFLGLNDPTAVSWGQVLNRALLHQGLYFSPLWVWWVLPAGLAITLTVLGFTFVGVGFEPVFNPRTERVTL